MSIVTGAHHISGIKNYKKQQNEGEMNRLRSDDEWNCEVGIKPYNVDHKDDDGKAKRTDNNLLFMSLLIRL